jgi:GntR family transcriptional repressor for pyruvate dehydrogenase complex
MEGESARLAAISASINEIAKLEEIVRKQKAFVSSGGLAVEEDVRFHETLAKASGNKFVAHSVQMLRSHERLNYAVIAIRAQVGVTLAVQHEEIISAVRDRDPDRALKTMQEHIAGLIDEVERYWDRAFRKPSLPQNALSEELAPAKAAGSSGPGTNSAF